MPWHDISDGGVLALVHQEDGRHLHSAPHRSPDWASERWWLREDGFEFPGARQLGNRPIRPRAAPTSKVRKTLDTTRIPRNDAWHKKPTGRNQGRQRAGLIRYKHGHVTILDLAGLKKR